MLKINLISDVQEKKVQQKAANTYVTIGAAVTLAIVLGTILIIWGIIGSNVAITAGINKNINDTNTELAQYKDLEDTVISLEKGLAGARDILDGKYLWTKLLTHIEKATPADVQFTRLKLSSGKIEADLVGKDINSLARFVESFKGYQVAILSGKGNSGDAITIVRGGDSYTTSVKSDGTWSYAVSIDSKQDQDIIVTQKGTGDGATETQSKVEYTAATKTFGTENDITAKATNLFSGIDSKGYSKDDKGNIKFTVTMNFDEGALW